MNSTFGLDAVNVSFLSHESGERKKLPLVVTPRWDSTLSFLTEWTRKNRSWIDNQLVRYGAVLFRGFDIEKASEFESAIISIQPQLCNTYRGTSPRIIVGDTEYVFSAAEVPVNYPIAQHIEMSFLAAPPKQLFFGCMQPSNKTGGETALADFRQVFQDLPIEIRDKLIALGIRYQRTHNKIGSYFTYDVSDMLGWPEMFGTSDKKEVERLCQEEGLPYEWLEDDTFRCTTYAEAFQLHPVTKQPTWFNHTQVFHWTTFPAELWFAWKRCKDWRLFFHALFVTIFCTIQYGVLGNEMSLHATFGDGTPISVMEMHHIRKAIHKNMVFSRWQKGDLLMIDNFSISHGRQPTYDKGRKIVVSWSNPIEKANEFTASTADAILAKPTVVDFDSLIVTENPQEKTPESSLTKSDSAILQQKLHQEMIAQGLKETPGKLNDKTHQEATMTHYKKAASMPSVLQGGHFYANPNDL